MNRRITAALCALLLLCAGLAFALPVGAVTERVYFMGVNDNMMELNSDTMPRVVNGELYVPYTMFDPNAVDGAGLGLFSNYSRTKGTVIIYSRSDALIFDLNANNSSGRGVTYLDKAIIRNSMVFVPVAAVCDFFGLEYSRLTVEYGHVIRVKSSAAVLSDAEFTEAAASLMWSRYQSYLQSKVPAEEPATPAESTSPGQTEPEPGADGARIYLAFRMEAGDGLTGILNHLERYGAYGVFFCRPDELLRRDGEIRTLTARGHRVGLLLDADTLEGQLEQAARGQELLAHVARMEAAVYFSENLSDGDRAALGEGLCLWETTLDATPGERSVSRQAEAVTGAVRSNRRYFALLDDGAQSFQALGRILSTLVRDGCEFRLANEVVLGAG